MNRPVITLTTDFGTRDSYVGAMKGVILGRCPQAHIVDISHEIEPQSISQGAYVLATGAKYFPPETTHIAVVDPGVGSERRPIAMQTPTGTFVGPDNGILSLTIAEFVHPPAASQETSVEGHDSKLTLTQFDLSEECRGVVLDDSSFWLPNVTRTFHGRDVFAPVAANIANGVPISDLGSPIETVGVITSLLLHGSGMSSGTIVHIDRYGNLITNIPEDAVSEATAFEVAGHRVTGLSRSYSESVGQIMAIIGSQGTVEIALGNGNAAEALKASVGDSVTILAAAP